MPVPGPVRFYLHVVWTINDMSTITLVTGGNRGIGREVCRQLAGRGQTVVLTARSAGAAAAAARATGAEPRDGRPVPW